MDGRVICGRGWGWIWGRGIVARYWGGKLPCVVVGVVSVVGVVAVGVFAVLM